MSVTTMNSRVSDVEEQRNNDLQAARAAAREAVQEIRANFSSPNFVELSSGFYNKNELVSVRFYEDSIHARFSSGDIVDVNESELRALTS